MNASMPDRLWDGPGVDAWRPWTPTELARRLAGSTACWSVVGGWSVDLFVGTVTRPHHDLEIATIQPDLAAIRRCLGGACFAVGGGSVRRLADDEPSPPGCHQHWLLDEEAGAWRVDVMVEPGDAGRWVFRRDERVSAPRHEMTGRTTNGIPFLKPHGALLYKAKAPAAKDEADFQTVVPRMDEADRQWLHTTLQLVDPGHPWLSRLP